MNAGQRRRADDELDAAAKALRAADLLLDAGLVLDAISRLYYAVFHAARAALLVHGKHTKTHTGQVTQFIATFGPEPLLGRLLRLRIVADYTAADFDTGGTDVRTLFEQATGFVERCRGIVAAEVARGVNDPDPPPDL